ncbi:LOW QUALITY PROTEIN: piezo-type mechanosensitive ion channel component-like [Penaeus monodon]|uniref:LOW QUALITY PROTEIN: piezo-type mechanosensitive ion channel component-like n=1 Tax=Penaeus monodon TaxID=6687 RepID=UPI0018A79B98|nr:LOW QUALITY PROTEIN: piezo-type mechanosensitive ion channel component-like [Penaeus monodon]
MAAHQLVATLIFRLLLPLVLGICAALRFSLMSLTYLLLVLAVPLLPAPAIHTMRGHTGRYLKAVAGISVVNFLLQFTFQIVLLSLPPYAYFLEECSFLEELMRHLGFVRLDGISEVDGTRWLLPECILLVFSPAVYVACLKLTAHASPDFHLPAHNAPSTQKNLGLRILNAVGTYLALAMIGGAGVMVPSVTSSVYFIVFMASATYWSLNNSLGRRFGYVCRGVMVYSGIHVVFLYIYQAQWIQEHIPPDSLGARVTGLTAVVQTNCTDPRSAQVTTDEWSKFVNPILLLLMYFVLAFESQFLLSNKEKADKVDYLVPYTPHHDGGAVGGVTDDLGSGGGGGRDGRDREGGGGGPGGGEGGGGEEENSLQRLIAPLVSVFQLVIRSSYIATNIVMMAWSITYHSWLTFVLLLWACVLWMIPNQRAAMLRCSPFLVVYAELLLLLQYIYCMDLTDSELPSEMETVNLSQIGLVKVPYLACKPLLVKVLYTCMFWITLRQYVQEVIESTKREMSTAAALQPFTVAVSTTNTGQPVTTLITSSQDEPTTSPVMERLGQWLRGLLVKFWIWVVAIMLFVFGIQGSQVVIFRIMYMVLFLIFTITFQLSYSAWRNFLYGFWLTVIIYQMFVLVLTYTYQFDNFPTYWENYTGIPKQLQNDMGLEVYDTGRLFIKLMTPTFFVIVTIIQVHYFHKDFLALSDIEKIPDQPAPKDTRKTDVKVSVPSRPNLLESCTLDDVKGKESKRTGGWIGWWMDRWRSGEADDRWLLLMLACYDVCALHWAFAVLATVAVPCPERIQTYICRTCVALSSLLLIVRMIYQINYIDPEGWAANCTDYENSTWPKMNETANNAVWLGLSKVPSLPKYLKGYIGIIVVITVQAVVRIRQQYQRQLTGLPPPPPGVLFPNVTRAVADDGIPECAKFLLNYGFYKFGVEICLMSLVGVIGTRLDVYSLFYAGWLCYFFNRQRKDIARVWKAFVISITVLIPLQYLMCVGIPPALCIDYPWHEVMDPELREWLFFPDFVKPPESYKIVTDFCLLVFAVCQQRVFEIEFGPGAEEYEGGSNKEIVHEDPATLVNPIPDFVTYTRNYLDMVKVVVFFTSYWITLAVMFLGGTNRVTLVALGYVLGAFVFLWLGNEFYLRPLSTILRLWNYLLGYNVSVIVVKTFLQLLGCVFLSPLAINACWFVQLLGIACVKKFGDNSDDRIVEDLTISSSSLSSPPLDLKKFCAVPKSEAGLMWDGICFGFLLMQRRLFSSFYFQHLVTEMKAQTKLASRGAELIAELMQKEIAERQAAEAEVLNKIKEKMDRIKATQQLVQANQSREPNSHYEAGGAERKPPVEEDSPAGSFPPAEDPPPQPVHRKLGHTRSCPLLDGGQLRASDPRGTGRRVHAIRSGDYYMFEDYGDYAGLAPLEIPEEPPQGDTIQGMTVSELISSALKTDIVEAAEEARAARLSESDAASRRSSFIRRPVHRTLSGRSQVSMASRTSRTSRTTSRSVRIHPRPRSPPAVPHSPPPLPRSPPPKSSSPLASRPRPPSTLPPLPPLPQLDGGYLADDSTAHDYSEIEPAEPQGLAPMLRKIVHWAKFAWEFLGSLMISATQQLNRLSKDYRYVASCLAEEKKRLKVRVGPRCLRKIVHWAKFAWEFLGSLMISATQQLNRLSKDYRYVASCLAEEKKRLKETEGFCVMPGSQPLNLTTTQEWTEVPLNQHRYGGQEPLEIRVEKASEDKTDDSVDFVDLPEGAEKEFKKEQPPVVKLMVACWYAMLSRSELVSYIMIFVNQIKSASLLSLPLPFMVFLWGSLSVPRPSKTFWITVIAYTEVIVVVKYLFQFDFFPWNQVARLKAPFWPPRIIGVEKKDRYAVYDLALLLVVFFHRFMLKSLGLWKESSDTTPTASAHSSPSRSSSQSSFTQSRTSSSVQPIPCRKPTESSASWTTCKEDSSNSQSHSGDGSTLSYTKDTSLLSKDTRESSLTSKDTKDSSLNLKELKDGSLSSNVRDSSLQSSTRDTSLPSHTRESSLPTTTKESSLTLMEHEEEEENSLLLNANDDSLLSRASEPLPASSPPRHLPPAVGGRARRADALRPGHAPGRRAHRSGSEVVAYRRTWSPCQSYGRHPSVCSQPPGGLNLRASSLATRRAHRRHLSEGSRVSFNERPLSTTSHCTHLSQSQASESVHVTCAACNLQALKDFQKPDFEEVKENIQQLPKLAKGGADHVVGKVRGFIAALLHPQYQVSVDVYAYMFFCDFFNFFVLIFGFSAFGTQQGDGGVSAYLEDNRVPVPFLVMLILQFGLIIVDRALFLRKFILGKLIFQVALTFGIHIWMFFILPAVTEREFNDKHPPQIWYMVKCLNLLLSAYQIRCGYPTRILGNFLCKQYNYINLFAFRMFMNVPFLFELRTLMDWIWTDTSMNLSDWVKMEDIFSHIFQIKCERRAEDEYPQGRGESKRKIIKYGMGGCALLGVIALIWFPLVLFALSNTVGQPNPPYDVTVEISIGAYQPIFRMTAQQQSLYTFSTKDWDSFNYHYRADRQAQTFLSNYDFGDVVVAELSGNFPTRKNTAHLGFSDFAARAGLKMAIWGISPPAQRRLISDLQSLHPIRLKMRWSVKRPSKSPDVASECKDETEIQLKAFEGSERNPVRDKLVRILEGELDSNPVLIENLLPKFLKVTNKGQALYVPQLEARKRVSSTCASPSSPTALGNLSSTQEWWEVEEECKHFTWLPRGSECRFLTIYTFNDKAFPEGLSFISGGGIVGMYTTLVLVAGKMLRGYFAGSALKIMFDDMPNVDRIMQLCLDIYLVRESRELELEEDLFAKLVFLFRSPETLIKWTRPEEEETPEGEEGDPQLE